MKKLTKAEKLLSEMHDPSDWLDRIYGCGEVALREAVKLGWITSKSTKGHRQKRRVVIALTDAGREVRTSLLAEIEARREAELQAELTALGPCPMCNSPAHAYKDEPWRNDQVHCNTEGCWAERGVSRKHWAAVSARMHELYRAGWKAGVDHAAQRIIDVAKASDDKSQTSILLPIARELLVAVERGPRK